MISKIKSKLIKIKKNILVDQGIANGDVAFFEEKIYTKLANYYFNSFPLSIHMKYLVPKTAPGNCFERSQYLSFAFDHPILLSCDVDLNQGRDRHCFIENDGWVYDPTKLVKIKKELYYKMYRPTIIEKYEGKNLENLQIIKEINNNSLDKIKSDLQDIDKKYAILAQIIQFTSIANASNDREFQDAIDKHMLTIGYKNSEDLVEKLTFTKLKTIK